ncbi:uncharacterized protein LOC129773764 [Toxorhynchites rutilus septentrionalis]|uniref:uncharacterized protein LOC129773764 n=1 Tax=Toxorhynchites rutilus septentrionalis TaxID=329112 RepID=UPI0024790185|nr:uncharacterized protein LOC129773764 [Toxorhynchites rutilus septentrionalis]
MPNRGTKSDGSESAPANETSKKIADGYSCGTCDGPDTDDMVQCDQCDGWYHYDCVGVSDEVVNQSWSCTNCKPATWIQRTTSTPMNQSTPITAKKKQESKRTSTVQETTATTTVRSSRESSSQKQSDSVLLRNAEHTLQSSSCNDQRKQKVSVSSIKGTSMVKLDQALSEVSCSSSQISARNRAKLQLMRLQEEKDFEERQQHEEAERRRVAAEKQKEFIAKKYEILENLASDEGSIRSSGSVISRSRIEEWVVTASHTQFKTDMHLTVQQSSQKGKPQEQMQQEQFQQQKRLMQQSDEQLDQEEILCEQQIANQMKSNNILPSRQIIASQTNFLPDPVRGQSVRFNPNTLPPSSQISRPSRSTMGVPYAYNQFQLSNSQIAARQAVSKDLPTFFGNPVE